MEDKDSYDLDKEPDEAYDMIKEYFFDVAKNLIDWHIKNKGFESYDTFELLDFWRKMHI